MGRVNAQHMSDHQVVYWLNNHVMAYGSEQLQKRYPKNFDILLDYIILQE